MHAALWKLGCVAVIVAASAGAAAGEVPASGESAANLKQGMPTSPGKVDVQPVARDDQIRTRLLNVLDATGWFENPQVRVDEGVVFLNGQTQSDALKKWAGDLVRNTQDVVAVVNRIEVPEPSVWAVARQGLRDLWRDVIRILPFLVFGFLVLLLFLVAAVLTSRGSAALLKGRVRARLLRAVMAHGLGLFVFLIGIYVVLRTSGLTQLALTVLGGTGLIGLVLGIAFRDITENFLASIFLSMQQPFATNDLVQIDGVTGYVQQLNVRTTVLMTFEGIMVQIPNSTVYKTKVHNFTTNVNRRDDFVVGIGFDDSIQEAQEVALRVLADHPAVLQDPEPAVLADNLGRATVNLRIYYWINGQQHSWLKVRSAIIRLVKVAFQKHGISMPDEAREVVFPNGVPVRMLEQSGDISGAAPAAPSSKRVDEERETATTKAEAGLYSEAGVIQEQARQSRSGEKDENLLADTNASP